MERYIIIDKVNDELSVVNKERDVSQEFLEAVGNGDAHVLGIKDVNGVLQVRKAWVLRDEEDESKFIIDDWELVA